MNEPDVSICRSREFLEDSLGSVRDVVVMIYALLLTKSFLHMSTPWMNYLNRPPPTPSCGFPRIIIVTSSHHTPIHPSVASTVHIRPSQNLSPEQSDQSPSPSLRPPFPLFPSSLLRKPHETYPPPSRPRTSPSSLLPPLTANVSRVIRVVLVFPDPTITKRYQHQRHRACADIFSSLKRIPRRLSFPPKKYRDREQNRTIVLQNQGRQEIKKRRRYRGRGDHTRNSPTSCYPAARRGGSIVRLCTSSC